MNPNTIIPVTENESWGRDWMSSRSKSRYFQNSRTGAFLSSKVMGLPPIIPSWIFHGIFHNPTSSLGFPGAHRYPATLRATLRGWGRAPTPWLHGWSESSSSGAWSTVDIWLLEISQDWMVRWWFNQRLWWFNQHSYWKWPFIVDLPIKNDDFP